MLKLTILKHDLFLLKQAKSLLVGVAYKVTCDILHNINNMIDKTEQEIKEEEEKGAL